MFLVFSYTFLKIYNDFYFMTKEEYWPMEKSLDCDGISVMLTESDESDHVKVTCMQYVFI